MATSSKQSDAGVVVMIIGVMIIVALAVALSPLILLAAGIWWYTQRSPTTTNALVTGGLIVASALLASWVWPSLYVHFKHSEDIPDVNGDSVVSAVEDLREAGFSKISYVDSTGPGSSGDCTVDRQSEEGSADTRANVTIWISCD